MQEASVAFSIQLYDDVYLFRACMVAPVTACERASISVVDIFSNFMFTSRLFTTYKYGILIPDSKGLNNTLISPGPHEHREVDSCTSLDALGAVAAQPTMRYRSDVPPVHGTRSFESSGRMTLVMRQAGSQDCCGYSR